MSEETAEDIREYVADYGGTLIDLPEDTWETSVSQWMEDYWDVIVDLWTVEKGRSDMIVSVRVFEAGTDYRFEIDGVWVP